MTDYDYLRIYEGEFKSPLYTRVEKNYGITEETIQRFNLKISKAKIRRAMDQNGIFRAYTFFCPACDCHHSVWDKESQCERPFCWGFNGDYNKPTFTPSLRIGYKHPKGYSNENPAPEDYDGEYVEEVCHFNITNGQIIYHGDCTHDLKNTTIEMEEA
jgi:hypothetical protein